MIRYENQCVGCPPEMGCLGSTCPNRNVPIYICDDCGDEFCDDEVIMLNDDGACLCRSCYNEIMCEDFEDD